ncbi:MAG: histidine phosphatase family protein [Deltaproteobacteria bacterium]|jgi:broad specificity phosphatase PhoE|nr:histidine phosphatase family protein [Deltaproteobacteria bacterium]
MSKTYNRLRIYFVRHGETRTEGRNLFNGWTDVDLTDKGRSQLEDAAKALEPIPFDRVISSDLYRARYGGGLIARGSGVALEVDREWREMNFGDCEGLEFKEIRERFPELAEKVMDPSEAVIFFPGGESDREFINRIGKAVAKLVSETPDGRVALVSHSGTMRAALASLFGFTTKVMWSYHQTHASLNVVDVYPGGSAVARVVNAYLGPEGYASPGPGLDFLIGAEGGPAE